MTKRRTTISAKKGRPIWSERVEFLLDAITRRPRRWGFAFGFFILFTLVARFALQNAEQTPPPAAPDESAPAAPPRISKAEKRAADQWAALSTPTTRRIDEYAPSKDSRRLQKLAKKMKAPGAMLVEPCLEWVGLDCVHGAMDVFYQSLLEIEEGRAEQHATVATLGNSLIASDHITDIVRERLSERFGSGGRGMVLADRISTYGRRTRSGLARAGHWRPHNFAMGDRGKYPFGVSGVLHVSTKRGARTRWKIDGEESADILFWDHPRASGFRLRIDGEEVKRVKSKRRNMGRRIRVRIPEGAKKLDLIADGREMVSYGANLEREKPGVIWNTFGVPAAGSTTFFESNEKLFQSQLKLQNPSLVVVMLGGNETKRIQWGKRTKEQVERDFRALLHRIRSDAPNASCLAIGPIDAVTGKPPKRFRTRPPLGWVINMQQRIAREQGCTYFNLFRAMGGAGSLKRFSKYRMLHDDLVHPRSKGLDLLGELIAAAIFEGYDAYAARAHDSIRERQEQIASHHLTVERGPRATKGPKLPRLARSLAAAAAPSSPPATESFTIGWFMEEGRKSASLVHDFEARIAKRLAFAQPLRDPVRRPAAKETSQLLEAWETKELASLVSFDAQATLDALRAKKYDMLLLWPAQESLRSPAPELAQAIERLNEGSEQADCVLISPLHAFAPPLNEEPRDQPDGGVPAENEREYSPLDASARTLTERTGCGFLSLREAIGGAPGFALWQKKGWLDDSGSPTKSGMPALTELILLELLQGAEVSHRPRLAQGATP